MKSSATSISSRTPHNEKASALSSKPSSTHLEGHFGSGLGPSLSNFVGSTFKPCLQLGFPLNRLLERDVTTSNSLQSEILMASGNVRNGESTDRRAEMLTERGALVYDAFKALPLSLPGPPPS